MTTIEDVMHALPSDSWISAKELADLLGTDEGWMRRKLQRLRMQGWAERDGDTSNRPCRWRACGGSVRISKNLFWMEGRE